MFTGIIEAVGHVQAIVQQGGDVRLTLATGNLDLQDVKLGDSIASNGICLTVVAYGVGYFCADVSAETLRRTMLGKWRVGTRINLEKALLPTTRLGGHIVSGHVDGVGEIITATRDARSLFFEVAAPASLAKYLAEKGSITVDGISLTINNLNGAVLSLNLVPHTAAETNIVDWHVGTQVNLEVDVLARYIERLMLGDKAADPSASTSSSTGHGISMAFLQDNGFA